MTEDPFLDTPPPATVVQPVSSAGSEIASTVGSPPVPSNDGVWFHDDEHVGPPGPDSPQHDPKEPIDGGQSRTWMAARQDRELLPQRQVLERQVTS